jgi:transposase InsO family protein
MAWKGPCAVGERTQLVELVRKNQVSKSEAARVFGVSRKTVHKWLNRADELGMAKGLEDQSRARKTQDYFDPETLCLLLEVRRATGWGPETLLFWLRENHPELPEPAASTLGDFLKREKEVVPRLRRPRPGSAQFRPGDTTPVEPNDRWTIDFKGHFLMGNGARCFPLTVRDSVSRMVLRVDALPNMRAELVLPLLAESFAEHGLPLELHSDNGAPFGSTGLANLGRVAVFVMKYGVRPVFSRPAKPQDNGGHERMHIDLKVATTRPPGNNLVEQQELFDAFRYFFDNERPHHALGGKTPAKCWVPSLRKFPTRPPAPEYARHLETRIVDRAGNISWRAKRVHASGALIGETLGLEEIEDGLWRVHFFGFSVGLLDERREDPKIIGVNRPGD